jgi:hypothetical protein
LRLLLATTLILVAGKLASDELRWSPSSVAAVTQSAPR